jgi:hypothetical protein
MPTEGGVLPVIVVAAFAAWLLALALVARANRPHRPEPGPRAMDLGPEPPAIANLLTHDWDVTPDAVPATLLDLAARHLLRIDQVGPGRVLVRLRRRPAGDLAPFERRVLQQVERRALDGVVPAQALAIGMVEEARAWWKQFRREVVAEAKRLELSRRRWSRPAVAWLGGLALLPCGLLWLLTGSLLIGVVAWLLLLAILGSFGDQRDTPAGLAAAGRWLGVRAYLAADPTFEELSPAAVATWDRYLAYGAALGVAPAAVRALPMGVADDHRTWSSYGGGWRVVRIRYPGEPARMPANRLLAALVRGAYTLSGSIVQLLLGCIAVVAPLLLVAAIVLDVLRPDHPGLPAVPRTGIDLAAAGCLVTLALLTRALVRWLAGRADRRQPRQYEGAVVRLRNRVITHHDQDGHTTSYEVHCYAAVDDGAAPLLRAFEISESLYRSLCEGSIVQVSVGPRGGRLFDLRLLRTPEGAVPPPPIHRGDDDRWGLGEAMSELLERARGDDTTEPAAGKPGAAVGAAQPVLPLLQRLQQRAAEVQARRGAQPLTPGRKVLGGVGAILITAFVVALLVGLVIGGAWLLGKLGLLDSSVGGA